MIRHVDGAFPAWAPEQRRRDFLRGAVAAGILLAAPKAALAEGDAPAAPVALETMSIARWKGALLPGTEAIKQAAIKLTERAIAALGGMGRFVKQGDTVWIKPNMSFGIAQEFAVTTNPDVVATLVRLCFEAGAKKVRVGDCTMGRGETYIISGIEPAVLAAGGEVVYLDKARFKDFELRGERLTVWPLYTDIVESDVVINVPILKQHALTKVSACLKNLMGGAGGRRELWHRDMPRCLTDVAAFVKPKLCVLDAVRTLVKGGPTGGNLDDVKLSGLVAAGTDIVALDAFGAELLGLDPAESRTMAAAQARGLGVIDYRSLHPKVFSYTPRDGTQG